MLYSAQSNPDHCQFNKESKMDFGLAYIRILFVALVLMILAPIVRKVLQPPAEPNVIETYSTVYAAFAVVDGSAEAGCNLSKVKLGAVRVDQSWKGYVYGPPPGVLCARPVPHYRSQTWCRALADCVVSDIDKQNWDALFESSSYAASHTERL